MADIRELPKNIEAEQVVLGSVMLEPESVCRIVQEKKLEPEHFYEARHRVIYASIKELLDAGDPPDIVILSNHLEDKNDMEKAGGRMYLNELLDRTSTTASIEHYIDIVKTKSAMRQIIEAGAKIEEVGYKENVDIAEVFSKATQIIGDIDMPEDKPPYVMLGDEVAEQISILEQIHAQGGGGVVGVPSGFAELDKITSGFRDSDLIIIAARPGVGKSAMTTSIARRAALDGYKVGFFSLEMSREQMLQRLLCGEARVNLQKMRGGYMGMEDWRRLTDVAGKIRSAPIYVDDTPGNPLSDIVSRARRMKENEAIDMLFIDYLQLIEIPGFTRNRENEVAKTARTLKKLARELEIPIIALSQLNRNTEQRTVKNKRPTLADLRESGALEQDTDMVIFIYRDDYYNTETEEIDTVVPAELIIAKQRNGPLGRVHVSFHKSFVDFYPNVYADEYKGFGFTPEQDGQYE